MSSTTKSLIKSTLILGAAGVIVKIVGALYRIVLADFISLEGMSYYQQAFPVYSALLIISTVGLPIAISKLVSERVTTGDYKGAYAVFRTSRMFLILVGLATSVAMFCLAGPITQLQALPGGQYSLMALAPALFFVSVMCAYRGYFQGLQNMKPTALSQIIEQFVKVGVGLAFAYFLLKWTGRMEFGAAGALLGITVSEAVALLYTMGAYGKQKRQMTQDMMLAYKIKLSWADVKPLLGKVLILALPITVAGLVMPIVAFVDSVIIPRSMLALGYESAAVRSMYGTLSGGVLTIINLAAIVSQALQMSVVPAISEALKLGDNDRVKANVLHGIKFAFLEGIPVTVAFFVFASPIFSFLYPGSTPAQHQLATGLLMTMCSVAVFLPFMQTMTGVLQGIGKQNLPPIALAVGAGVKIGLSLFLMSIPQINIYGAVIGTVMCYVIAAVMNYLFVRKYTGVRIKWGEHLLKPIAATAVMASIAYLVYSLIAPYSNAVGVIACVLVGLVVYFFMLVLVKAVNEREMLQIRGGKKIVQVLKKIHVWR
ncbi:MAG: polysaccharide biosynthesis protein [Christensenella sp.]|uniref:putative polysaccharide biosynthesis protein n=1 Tax=Christensenella sp. TaxID=1935934 RepID=UPI002B210877|nr:polysaccharide biosynthesis protein [Christensenella sp.]MEA5001904.1 polysaccharide biosynthesis protein [Christensenella sp.]